MTAEELGQFIATGGGVKELSTYVRAGGDVNAIEPGSHQNLDIVRALVQYGADIDRRDSYGQTPLHIAVDIDVDSRVQAFKEPDDVTFETARLLIELGASPQLADNKGRTPRDLAAGYGKAVLARFDRLVNTFRSK